MPLVKSVEEAAVFHGVNPETVIPDLSGFPEHLRAAGAAALRLILVNAAINENKPFDWNDSNPKHYAWWDLETWEDNPGGFRFRGSGCDNVLSDVGSRLCFHEKSGLQHSTEHFSADWEAFIK